MLALILGAVLTFPSLNLSLAAAAVEMPANLVFVVDVDQLNELQPWDLVELTDDAGAVQDFVVAWSRLYPKDSLPPEVYDGPASGGRVLTLITDAPLEEDGYPHQRVVRAVPLP
jgi:hypothetical protein